MGIFIEVRGVLSGVLATFTEFEGVATFDAQGAVVVLKRGGKRYIPYSVADVKDEKLFWLYAQKDITGTDVKLPSLAQAIIPINEHNTLTELVQGSGRLREIHAGQQGWFCLDHDASNAIKKSLGKQDLAASLTYFDLLTYCVLHEAELKGRANVHSLELQWDALLENTFWDFALQASIKQAIEAFALLQDPLLVASTPDAPLKRPPMSLHPVKIEKALALLKDNFERKTTTIEASLQSSPSPLKHQFTQATFTADVKKIQQAMAYPKRVLLNDDANATQVAQAASNVASVASADLQLIAEEQKQGEQVAENRVESTQLWTSWVMNAISSKITLPHQPKPIIHPHPGSF